MFIAVKRKLVLWVAAPCSVVVDFNPEEGVRTVLRNIGIHPPHYTVQQLRKPRIVSTPL